MEKSALEKKSAMRWGVERRMEFIEFRLLWEGGINRSDIVDQFGVSAPQASNDLSQYKESAPTNIEYDLSEKRYFASKKFKPQFLKPNSDRYLSQLKLIADHLVSAEETWLSIIPGIDSVPIPHRRVDIDVLKQLINAVRNQRSVEVHYQSMNPKRPDPTWRWITPHAFANDGMRWHVRAFCHEESKFKDFILSRFLEIGKEGEPGAPSSQDKGWHESIDVILAPNPKFSPAQRKIIAMDYGMEKEKLKVPVRKAILYYFKKRLRLDVAEKLDDQREVPVVVENKDEFETALAQESSPTLMTKKEAK
jgi:predicted DNA-binding transcriptional regulator YafY